MPPPSPRPTLKDVAALAGVSVATCSYVLSGRHDRTRPLPPQTQRRVTEAARKLDYSGNTAARLLRRQRTELVALVYAPPVGPWLDQLTMQCEDLAAEHGYSVIGVPIRRLDRSDHSLRVITQGYVDGVIFAPWLADQVDVNALAKTTRAMIAFSEQLRPGPLDVVRNNVRAATAEATAYLLKSRRRVALLTHEPDASTHDELYHGYLDGHRYVGRPVDPALIRPGAKTREDAIVSVRHLLSRPQPPDALVSESDRGALAALQVAHELGIPVPDRLAVLGVGNTREAAFASPPLSSIGMVEFDFHDVIEALFARIDDPNRAPQELVKPWVLNHRATTDVPR